MSETVYIGFGSNVGDRFDYCDRAVTLLDLLPYSRVVAISSLYETEPVRDRTDPGSGWFLNGVVHIATELDPARLLAICQEVEAALGRDLDHRQGPRTLDLDILFYGPRIIEQPSLTVPHPRLHARRFVLVPMVELAPDWVHPRLHRTMRELLSETKDPSTVRRIESRPGSRYGSRRSCSSAHSPQS